jgi:hypothetical protein
MKSSGKPEHSKRFAKFVCAQEPLEKLQQSILRRGGALTEEEL